MGDAIVAATQLNDVRVIIALFIVGATSIALTLHWVLRTVLPWFIGLVVRHRAASTPRNGRAISFTSMRRAKGRTAHDGGGRSMNDYSTWDSRLTTRMATTGELRQSKRVAIEYR
jgi:uncharacterized membrane protein YjgN (DUF898 family)